MIDRNVPVFVTDLKQGMSIYSLEGLVCKKYFYKDHYDIPIGFSIMKLVIKSQIDVSRRMAEERKKMKLFQSEDDTDDEEVRSLDDSSFTKNTEVLERKSTITTHGYSTRSRVNSKESETKCTMEDEDLEQLIFMQKIASSRAVRNFFPDLIISVSDKVVE